MLDANRKELEALLRGLKDDRHISDLVHLETSWYKRWYVERMVEQEILRSERCRHEFALISFRVQRLGAPHDERREAFSGLLIQIADESLRATDFPAVLSEGTYAVLLPETDRTGAEVVMKRLAVRLRDYGPKLESAVFPEDGKTLHELMGAVDLCDEGNLVDIRDYQQSRTR